MRAAQLAKGDERAGKRQRANEHADEDLDFVDAHLGAQEHNPDRDTTRCRPARRPSRRSCAGWRRARACWSSPRALPGWRRSPPLPGAPGRAGHSHRRRARSMPTAISMPMPPSRLPRRAESCADKPPGLDKEHPARRCHGRWVAKRRAAAARGRQTRPQERTEGEKRERTGCSFLKHPQHALRNQEAAGDVDRRKQDRRATPTR